MARQRWQGTQGIGNCHHRHAIIGKACHRQGKGRKDARHRHAIIGIIGIGMPSSASSSASARHAIIGIGRSRHRQGIGMPSACHHRHQQDAGRQDAA
jgi:hypothetical protein